jgi:nitroreductase
MFLKSILVMVNTFLYKKAINRLKLTRLGRNLLNYRLRKELEKAPVLEELRQFINIQKYDCDTEEFKRAMLRKYAHIIEKGLLRRDFVKGHSRSVYNGAKYILHQLKESDESSVKWACFILEGYEKKNNGGVLEKREDNLLKGKYANVEYEKLFSLMKNRRSIRFYKHNEVSRNIVEQIIEPANWAPSSCNKQPIKIFCTNKAELARVCLKQFKGGTCFGDYIPSFFVFCADIRAYVLPGEMFLPHIDVSLGVQNLLLAASTLGLEGTILSWAQKDNLEEKNIREILDIPVYYQIICGLVLGYPEFYPSPPARKSLNETFKLI